MPLLKFFNLFRGVREGAEKLEEVSSKDQTMARRDFMKQIMVLFFITTVAACSNEDPADSPYNSDPDSNPPDPDGGNPSHSPVSQAGLTENEFYIESLTCIPITANNVNAINHYPHQTNQSPIGGVRAIANRSKLLLKEGDVVVSILAQRLPQEVINSDEGIANYLKSDSDFDYIQIDIVFPKDGAASTIDGETLPYNITLQVSEGLTYREYPANVTVLGVRQQHYKLTGGQFTLTAVKGTNSLLMADPENKIPVITTEFIVNQEAFQKVHDGTLIRDPNDANTEEAFTEFVELINALFAKDSNLNGYVTRIILHNGSRQTGSFYGMPQIS